MISVVNNMAAMNAQRLYGQTAKSKAKTTEKLSSGYRINRAADDAAGLTISEKMRSQIRGLTQGGYNCQDGMKLINIADGAMEEIQSMVHRSKELCIKSANGTNTAEDRKAIDEELQQLGREIDRIGNTAEYNTIKVLQGGHTDSSLYVAGYDTVTETVTTISYEPGTAEQKSNISDTFGRNSGQKYGYETVSGGKGIELDFSKITSNDDWEKFNGVGFSYICNLGCGQEFAFKFDNTKSGITDETPSANISSGGTSNNKAFTVGTSGYTSGEDFLDELVSFVEGLNGGSGNKVGHDLKIAKDGGKLIAYGSSGSSGKFAIGVQNVKQEEITHEVPIYDTKTETQIKDLPIHYGANSAGFLTIPLPHIDSETLDFDRVRARTQDEALKSLSRLDNILSTVSSERSKLGAFYNGIEHLYNNDMNTAENTQAAESVIRDTDMAEEMVRLSMLNILQQAGEAMMSQANQSTQGVLSLLQ